jgi:hypothetical protein
MNFTDPKKALDTIEAGAEVEQIRSNNRRKVNDLFNSVPPLSADDALRQNLKVNVNWGEAAVLAHHARRQYANAFIKPKRYFKIILPDCEDERCSDWELFMTKKINRPLKREKRYTELWRNRIASIVAHGIGPQIWYDQECWLPRFVSVENLRVPTDTQISFENLEWFSERREYTPGELSERVFGKGSLKGWNKAAIKKILAAYHDTNYEQTDYGWADRPEKMAEHYKQNGHFYSGDAVPSINLWHLYFLDRSEGKRIGWKMRVLPDRHVRGFSGRNPIEFLFNEGSRIRAEKLDQILQVQFGDLSNKAPFLYHSVRSLGFMLTEPCFWTNMARCRLLQHMFEGFNMLFQTSDPNGRIRALKVELMDRGFLPEGVRVVPAAERHQIDPNLVNMTMAQLKQLMQEASASYTQELDTGTKKEQTAYETAVKMSMVNAMMSGLLSHAFSQETHAYREICRRFTKKSGACPEAKQFQKDCKKYGIPPEWIDSEEWDIEPEVPIGAGNPVAEQSQIKALMDIKNQLSPVAQQEVMHTFVSIMTDNPHTADRMVPLDQSQKVSNAQKNAEFSFPVLMHGLPVSIAPELNVIDQIETLIGLLAGEIDLINRAGGEADFEKIVGLHTVAQHINKLIAQLAQDPNQKSAVKSYGDALGKLMNEVKAYEQRLAESEKAEQEQQGMSKEGMAKIAELQAKFEAQQQLEIMKAEARMERENIAFANEQGRKDAETAAAIERENLKAMSAAEQAKVNPPKQPAKPSKK